MPSVSESFLRKEGPEKLTGVAKYIDDYPLPGCLHAVTLRSSIARGVIKKIHFDPAFDWDGVTVVTAKDIPGQNYVYLLEVGPAASSRAPNPSRPGADPHHRASRPSERL